MLTSTRVNRSLRWEDTIAYKRQFAFFAFGSAGSLGCKAATAIYGRVIVTTVTWCVAPAKAKQKRNNVTRLCSRLDVIM